jgi:hypothetical protein
MAPNPQSKSVLTQICATQSISGEPNRTARQTTFADLLSFQPQPIVHPQVELTIAGICPSAEVALLPENPAGKIENGHTVTL